jgi:Mrp family chromosome partitioning ATPase
MVAPVIRTTQTLAPNVGVEKQLDQLIERLGTGDQSPATRALLIEARRMKSIIANWRTVAPLPQVREEMLARVLHLSAAVGDNVASPPSSRPPKSSQLLPGVVPSTGLRLDHMGGGAQGFSSEETVINEGLAALPQTSLDVHPVQLPNELSPHLSMLVDPHSQRADAYRALRHRLAGVGDPKVIGVTSPWRREGKTTAAINLAVSLREGARGRVLLLEANVRAPSVAVSLGFMPPVCFAEQLIRHRQEPLDPWVAVEPLAPLHVMAVSPQKNRPPLLDPIGLSIAIDRLRMAGYDYIVVDTPPVLESADVNMIADSVDGLVMTALARKSDTKSIKRAMNHIGQAAFLGTLLLE